MKKLLTSAIAGLALIFGFASCAGGLHDNEVAPLYIEGVKGTREAMTKVSDSEMTYTFTYKSNTHSSNGAWGSSGGQIAFKTMVDENGWARDFGAPKDETITIKVGDEEYVPLKNREADNVGGAGPGNIFVYDLVEGEEYVIRMKYNAATLSGSIRIEGLAAEGVELNIITNQIDKKGKIISYTMKRAGSSYESKFIAAKNIADFKYIIDCPAVNAAYTSFDGETLSQVSRKVIYERDEAGNMLDAKGNVTTDASKAVIIEYAVEEKNYMDVELAKGVEYSITVDASDNFNGLYGNISFEATTVSNFENAQLIGNWNYADTHDGDWEEDVSDGKYTFTAKNTTVEFKIIREKDDTSMAWGGGIIKPGEEAGIAGTEASLTYKTTKISSAYDEKTDKDKYVVIYDGIDEKAEKTALEQVSYVKATGLTKGKKYVINLIEDSTSDPTKAKISLTEKKPVDLTKAFSSGEVYLRGTMNGWGNDAEGLEKGKGKWDAAKSTLTYGPYTAELSSYNFKLGDSSEKWGVYNYGAEEKTTLAVKESVDLIDHGEDITIDGLNKGCEYEVVVKVDNEEGKISLQVNVTKDVEKTKWSVESYGIAGKFTINPEDSSEWFFDKEYTKDKDTDGNVTMTFGPYTVNCEDKGKTALDAWGFISDSSWGIKYTGCMMKLKADNKTGIKVKLTKGEGANNIVYLGKGTKFSIKITVVPATKEDDNGKTVVDEYAEGSVYAELVDIKDYVAPPEIKEPTFADKIATWYVHGPFVDTSWNGLPAADYDEEEGIITFGPFVATTNPQEWGLTDTKNAWANKYVGAKVVLDGGEDVTIYNFDALGNSKIYGIEVGDKFKIIIRVDNDTEKVYASAVKVE